MASSQLPLLLSLFLLVFQLQPTKAKLLNSKFLTSTILSQLSTTTHLNDTRPTVYFEVTKPIKLPRTKPCSQLILSHDFGNTYGKPPVLANYTPPSHCTSQKLSKIILEWKATCKGRQFDRIFGVWLGGVELLRGCTAEPTASGIVWSVNKDITRYQSLLVRNQTQTFAVHLGNVVDNTYTGVYHVNITINFYPAEEKLNSTENNSDNPASRFGANADLILPISQNLPLNDGLWFEIKNSMDTQVKEFRISQNAYRAVLEVYLSFHQKDEFWYSNLPNEYVSTNHLGNTPGNGPFREVVVTLDDEIVGTIWPFTVIYTGGINFLFWSPITGIGSFDLPSYDIEITPFLGNILDGKNHKFGFSITSGMNVWFVDANLHLWLDSKSRKTQGKLLKHNVSALDVHSQSDFTGLDGTLLTNVSRSISSTGWVKSSYGEMTTEWIQDFRYSNSMSMSKDSNKQIINQMIHFNDSVYTRMPSYSVFSMNSYKRFPLGMSTDVLDKGDESYSLVTNITLGFNEEKSKIAGSDFLFNSLKNLQNGHVIIDIEGNYVLDALWNTEQAYEYRGSDLCYFRNISSLKDNILYDIVSNTCMQ
ncbi:hypothetical protein Pint_04740 [Pistacia integerrima]|uniref:Uncharacterized protein n=1 Tax=Pistacia integerrima TaxID=434235 RepID=A0ACC0Z456_9ROSI|nr:hypothetical protein Pint_04740 [Pistacia integerrima]